MSLYINVKNVRGQPGSTEIVLFGSYQSHTRFDYSDMPPAYYKNWSLYGGMTLSPDVENKPLWVNISYTDRFGQTAFTGLTCTRDIKSNLNALFGYTTLEAGDGRFMCCVKSFPEQYRVSMERFNSRSEVQLPFDNAVYSPSLCAFEDEMIALFDLPNMTDRNYAALYYGGYMATSGTMEDILDPILIAGMGGAKEQGRVLDYDKISWQAVVPTMEEFKRYYGTAFQTTFGLDYNPIFDKTLPSNTWFLTSTPTEDKKAFKTINYLGEVSQAVPGEQVSVLLIVRPTIK